MDIAISCLARNKQVKIDDLFSEVNTLKHIVNELVLSKSLLCSWNFCIKSNTYLSYLLVNNHVIHRLNRKNPIVPVDIIRIEILTRLPIKSLMRFQCVCKSWQSFISRDPVFIKSHLARTSIDPNNDWLIVRCHSTVPREYVRSNKSDHPLLSSDMVLAGSVNGLVCLYRYDWSSKSISCIGIWNPVTHQYKYVPPPSTASNIEATDSSVALGFDPIKNDYKVIYITKNKAGQVVADVYSCNACSWGNINISSSFILQDGKLSKWAFNVNESVYWIHFEAGGYRVISFHARHEVFRLFPSPDYLPDQIGTMGNLRNFLACIIHNFARDTTSVDVYVLNETMPSDGGTWGKMYTIGPITLTKQMSILQCFRNNDLLFRDDNQFKLVCTDPESHAMLDSSIHPCDASRFNLSSAYGFGYIETIVSVMGMKTLNTNECDRLLFIHSKK